MLEGTLNTPLGDVKKSTAVLIGGGLIVVIGVGWYRTRKATQSSAAGANMEIDPATGYAYGSPEDAAALANQTRYVTPPSGSPSGGGPEVGPGSFTNNAQWAQYVETYMVQNNLVTDPSLLSAALGKYLAGQVPNADESNLIHQAIAYGGLPPAAGKDGYPPSIRNAPPNPPSGGPPKPPSGGPPKPPSGGPPFVRTPVRYQIRHGDTLEAIAHKFGVTVQQLRDWNMAEMDRSARKYGHANSRNGDLIFGGEWLTVGWK